VNLTIFTGPYQGGWLPSDLESFLGGNEESLVLFTRELANLGYVITVYSGLPDGFDYYYDPSAKGTAIEYLPHEAFDFSKTYETLITLKDQKPWLLGTKAKKAIHWSNDAEHPWSLRNIDHYVYLSSFHLSTVPWVDKDKAIFIPLGIADRFIDIHKRLALDPTALPPPNDSVLFSTSPDRGLESVLRDWPRVLEAFPDMELLITYDWSLMERFGGMRGKMYKDHLLSLCKREKNVKLLGRVSQERMFELFYRSKFCIYPMGQRPESDLAAFGALKAWLCGCKIILPTIEVGGFRDAIKSYVPYQEFLRGNGDERDNPKFDEAHLTTWKKVVEERWLPLLGS